MKTVKELNRAALKSAWALYRVFHKAGIRSFANAQKDTVRRLIKDLRAKAEGKE